MEMLQDVATHYEKATLQQLLQARSAKARSFVDTLHLVNQVEKLASQLLQQVKQM